MPKYKSLTLEEADALFFLAAPIETLSLGHWMPYFGDCLVPDLQAWYKPSDMHKFYGGFNSPHYRIAVE